jgi:hypothetical protein
MEVVVQDSVLGRARHDNRGTAGATALQNAISIVRKDINSRATPKSCSMLHGISVVDRKNMTKTEVRCAFSDRKLHSGMPLSCTPLIRLKRCHACDQWHSSRVFTFLPVHTVNSVLTLKEDLMRQLVHIFGAQGTPQLRAKSNVRGEGWTMELVVRDRIIGIGRNARRGAAGEAALNSALQSAQGQNPAAVVGAGTVLGFS